MSTTADFVRIFSLPIARACLVLVLSSCATPALNPNRFLIPEAKGQAFKGEILGGLTGVAAVNTTNLNSSIANTDTTPSISNSANFLAVADIGAWDRIDLYADLTNTAANFYGLKFQIWGAPTTTAQVGNFSVSLAAGIGAGSASARPEAATLMSSSQYSGWELISLFGYRTAETSIIYVNPFWTHLSAKVTISDDLNTTHLTPDGSGDMFGATFGGRIGRQVFATGELSLVDMQWTREQPSSSAAPGYFGVLLAACMGLQW
jgi:hypothetical protein